MRELRYTLPAKGQRTRVVTIATTLLDPVRYSKDEIAALYGVRWTVETHCAELKTTLKMRKVKSQTPLGVQKEVAVYCLVYNLVHVVMLAAARRQRVDPGRSSFLDTVRWLLSAAPGEALPRLVVNPSRPERYEPRVIKDRHDKPHAWQLRVAGVGLLREEQIENELDHENNDVNDGESHLGKYLHTKRVPRPRDRGTGDHVLIPKRDQSDGGVVGVGRIGRESGTWKAMVESASNRSWSRPRLRSMPASRRVLRMSTCGSTGGLSCCW